MKAAFSDLLLLKVTIAVHGSWFMVKVKDLLSVVSMRKLILAVNADSL